MKFRLGQDIIDLIRRRYTLNELKLRNKQEKLEKISRKEQLNRIKLSNAYSFKVYLYNYIIAYIPSFNIRRKYLAKIGVKIENKAFTHLGTHFYPNYLGGGELYLYRRGFCDRT